MNLDTFITSITQSPELLSGIFVYIFSSEVSCVSLQTELISYFKNKYCPEGSYIILDCETVSVESLVAYLTMPLFGAGVYSIKNSRMLTGQAKKFYGTFLPEYKGPQYIFLHDHALDMLESAACLKIVLPDKITAELYALCAQVFYGLTDKLFVQELFSKYTVLSCEQAFLLLKYQRILGAKASVLLPYWFDKLLEPHYSLFTLSSYLFAGQRTEFFTLWASVSGEYPQEFWVAFWSEQLWQALLFINKQQTCGLAEAKKLAVRLPFSFMQKDWRRYTCVYLTQAHTALYTLDTRIKNGAEFQSLFDIWFYKFFLT